MTEKFDQASVENSNEKLMLSTFGASTKFWEGFVIKYGNIEASVMEWVTNLSKVVLRF